MTCMRAAVMREVNKSLFIETVELGPVKPDDVPGARRGGRD